MKKRILATENRIDKDFVHLMNMYGLEFDNHNEGFVGNYSNSMISGDSVIHVYQDNCGYSAVVTDTTSVGLVSSRESKFNDIEDLISYLDLLMTRYNHQLLYACRIYDIGEGNQAVLAARSTRDLSKNLVRVKSSNIWAYGINTQDKKAKSGDVICQFKGKNGGPGDIYMYFDVPVKVWKAWLAAPSKGMFFWKNIRNEYYYRKLTGDKKGKLRNAVN